MPQLDLVSLFRLVDAGEPTSKLACETTAVAASYPGGQRNIDVTTAHADGRVSWAWSGRAGAALERDGSTKGSSNPKAAAEAEARKGAPKPRRPPPAIVICVLPAGKMAVQQRRPPVLGRGWRRPAGGARVFASEAVETAEPSSPKVSCFGAVRAETRAAAHAPAPAPRVVEEQQDEERSGCWASVTGSLRGMCRSDESGEGELPASEAKATASETPAVAVLSPPQPVPGLGDMKRLASRRWPVGMAGLER